MPAYRGPGARRRCSSCRTPIVMTGPKQTGVYSSRRPLCWGCHDIERGNDWSADSRAARERIARRGA